jgi:hypothetical protein
VGEVLRLAEEVLTGRLPMRKIAADRHSVQLGGGDGMVTIRAHRHGLQTTVHAATDQLRTSRLDLDVQYFMTLLPYEPGDNVRGRAEALPGGLSGS